MTRRELIQQLTASIPGVLSAATLANLLSSCTQGNKVKSINEKNENNSIDSFNQSLLHTLSSLSEVIIPATETPGAKEAQVPAFIETTVMHVFTAQERRKFIQGLALLDTLCVERYGDSLQNRPIDEQHQLAAELNRATNKTNKAEQNELAVLRSTSLDEKALSLTLECFAVTKSLTIFGFCTSKIGATQVLKLKPIPGRFDGCVPMEEVGTSWATS